ncbi:hypothetical protein M885DRAFT_500339 [Pelagophyceae sp. CCMP2097]|nr:hypothetical protein M885DRAFT_500339 [Pelagophyceae sp. CCMP2097]
MVSSLALSLALLHRAAFGLVHPQPLCIRRGAVRLHGEKVVKRAPSLRTATGLRIIDIVEGAGGRVTAADVAATGVADLETAERELLGLAALLGAVDGATLAVTENGDLVFEFQSGAKRRLAQLDSKQKWLMRWDASKPALYTAGRAAFGAGLLVSLATIATLLLALQSSAAGSTSSNDRGGAQRGGGGYSRSFYLGPSPWDVLYYQRYAGGGGARRRGANQDMGLLESIYSYVFGDAGPTTESMRRDELRLAAGVIRAAGGVVVAAELAPCLALPPAARAANDDSAVVDEAWVLPVVTALGGRARVDDDGTIVYVFDRLNDGLLLGDGGGDAGDADAVLREDLLIFSKANSGQLTAAGALGAVNLVGATALAAKLTFVSPTLRAALGATGLSSMRLVSAPLLLFAVGFNVIPFVRSRRLGKQNAAIDERNSARATWRQRREGWRRSLAGRATRSRNALKPADSGVAFSTGDSVAKLEQAIEDKALSSFDAMLAKKTPPQLQ